MSIKKILAIVGSAIVFILFMVFSKMCGNIISTASKVSWTEKEIGEFMGNCVSTASNNLRVELAKPYCECMLEKLRAKHPNPVTGEEFLQNNPDTVNTWAVVCLTLIQLPLE